MLDLVRFGLFDLCGVLVMLVWCGLWYFGFLSTIWLLVSGAGWARCLRFGIGDGCVVLVG